jgi:spermidine dehydrogenase
MHSRDRYLGMDRPISHRDFLDGVALAAGTALLHGSPLHALTPKTFYPPLRTGLRGSHEGSWEAGHALRDGRTWPQAADIGEDFDLVVVGGGISGLAAAFFYRESVGKGARILVLDNHDDFGGHAKRNEFRFAGRTFVMAGGSYEMESPSRYPLVARRLLAAIGVDMERFRRAAKGRADRYPVEGRTKGLFFDRETFGIDRLVSGYGQRPWPEFLAGCPLSAAGRASAYKLFEEQLPDPLPGLSSIEKKTRLARFSYRDFLRNLQGVDAQVISLMQARTHELFCVGIEAVPALYCWQMGYPGFRRMNLEATPQGALSELPGRQHGRQPQSDEPPIHFPDGNATIARLLVRALLPDVLPGREVEDVLTARVAYHRLDSSGQPVRIRLRSTAVRVERIPGDAGVAVTYVCEGRANRVRGRHAVLACWNMVVPYLCPELPPEQKVALSYGVKAPIVYTNVLIRSSTAFERLKVASIDCPGAFYSTAFLAEPVDLGSYRSSGGPTDPNVVQLVRTPCNPGLPAKVQHHVGRGELLATSFQTFEAATRSQLGRMLGPGGFDPASDVLAITVNRWPHGYAYNYNTLYDPPEWALSSCDARPCVVARRPFGPIAIANADAAASPHTDAAIVEAHRAVTEVLRHRW